MKPNLCSVAGCDRPQSARQLCTAHYQRARAHGDPGPAQIGRAASPACSVDDCSNVAVSKGHCSTHRRRRVLYGTLELPPRPSRDRIATWTGDEATYNAIHFRLRRQRGAAKTHTCPCGAPARQWSYDHADPDERVAPEGWRYSINLDHYTALCVPCHKRADLARLGLTSRKAAR